MSVSSSTTVVAAGLVCSYCGKPAVVMDHIIPRIEVASWDRNDFIENGLTTVDDLGNLTPACQSCNAAKGSKTLESWLAEMVLSDIDVMGATHPSSGTVVARKAIWEHECAMWVSMIVDDIAERLEVMLGQARSILTVRV